MTNCGACSESCCTSLEVTGGTFYRTYANDGGGPTAEADPASVSAFRLDKYLVTVGRFRQFVNAWNGGSGWTPPAGSGKHTHLNGGQGLANSASSGTYEWGWVTSDNTKISPTNATLTSCSSLTWTNTAGSQENLPMACVNWWESYAFCVWDGGFLPSEAEWAYAAAGGSQQREYPWGAADPGTQNQYAIYDDCYPGTAPVGTTTLGAGRWGQLDLAGEVGEWNLDELGTYVDPCADCAYLGAVSFREIRGGDFYWGTSDLLSSVRGSHPATYRLENVGFRCARMP